MNAQVKSHDLSRFLVANGIWCSQEDSRHGFCLGANTLDVSLYRRQFDDIGKGIIQFYRFLDKLGFNLLSSRSNPGRYLLKLLQMGLDGYPFVTDPRMPPFLKVDIVVDVDNALKVVEVDGYNPRGIAYAVLLHEMYGLQNPLLDALNRILVSNGERGATWLYSDRERFYLPSLKYLSSRLTYGRDNLLYILNANAVESPSALENIQFIAPWGLSKPNETMVRKELISRVADASMTLIYPMKPWYNNKALLALTDPQVMDPSLSEVVANSLDQPLVLQPFLPRTLLTRISHSRRNKRPFPLV